MQEYTPVKEGKVREIYDIGDKLIMVATDRISALTSATSSSWWPPTGSPRLM